MSEQKRTPMDDIMEKLQQGVQEMFQSDRYKEYLSCLKSFTQYSFNNSILIASQKPDATLVAGYRAWEIHHDRHVRKGEKGIKIIAPMPKKTENLVEKKDPVTGKTLLDSNGKPVMENVVIPQYRVVTVFDVSQTEGKELPTLDVQTLKGSVHRFEDLMEAIRRICPVPISIEKMEMEANGYYHHLEKRIVVKEGMSEAQTMKTTLHETAHALLHDRDLVDEMHARIVRFRLEVRDGRRHFADDAHAHLLAVDFYRLDRVRLQRSPGLVRLVIDDIGCEHRAALDGFFQIVQAEIVLVVARDDGIVADGPERIEHRVRLPLIRMLHHVGVKRRALHDITGVDDERIIVLRQFRAVRLDDRADLRETDIRRFRREIVPANHAAVYVRGRVDREVTGKSRPRRDGSRQGSQGKRT